MAEQVEASRGVDGILSVLRILFGLRAGRNYCAHYTPIGRMKLGICIPGRKYLSLQAVVLSILKQNHLKIWQL
jgi:hypothetical protein